MNAFAHLQVLYTRHFVLSREKWQVFKKYRIFEKSCKMGVDKSGGWVYNATCKAKASLSKGAQRRFFGFI